MPLHDFSPSAVFFQKIYDVTLAAAGTFDTGAIIPAGFSAILAYGAVRGTNATQNDNICARFNGDTGSNYNEALVRNSAGSAAVVDSQGIARIDISQAASASETANYFGTFAYIIPGYDSTSMFKTGQTFGGSAGSNTTGDTAWVGNFKWLNTAAITRIQMFGLSTANLAAGSRLTIVMLP